MDVGDGGNGVQGAETKRDVGGVASTSIKREGLTSLQEAANKQPVKLARVLKVRLGTFFGRDERSTADTHRTPSSTKRGGGEEEKIGGKIRGGDMLD